MLKVEIPKDKAKIEQQIKALEYQITTDTVELDKKIHEDALRDLRKALKIK